MASCGQGFLKSEFPADADFLAWLSTFVEEQQKSLADLLHQDVSDRLQQNRLATIAAVADRLCSQPRHLHIAANDGSDPQAGITLTSAINEAEEGVAASSVSPNRTAMAEDPVETSGSAVPSNLWKSKFSRNRAVSMDQQAKSIQQAVKRKYKNKAIAELSGTPWHEANTKTWLQRIVDSIYFEYISTFFIVAMTIVMIVEIQYWGMDLRDKLRTPVDNVTDAETIPAARPAFSALNYIFNALFLVELVLRLGAGGLTAWKNLWIWLDACLLILGGLDLLGLLNMALDPMILRLIRLLRLVRLLKVLKTFRAFDTLFLLIRSIKSSIPALVWSFSLLLTVQVITGIVLCQILQGFISDEAEDLGARQEVFKFFGTFDKAMLSMFEISQANWIVICRVLYSEVSSAYSVFFILYRCCFISAILNVSTAVFIAETNRCANSDDELMVLKHRRVKSAYCAKLKHVFEELDNKGDGVLTWDEFEPLFADDLLKTWLSTLEVDTHDLRALFDVMDEGHGTVTISEFTKGLTHCRGGARGLDVLKIITMSEELSCAVGNLTTKIDRLELEFRRRMDLFSGSPSGDVYQGDQRAVSMNPGQVDVIRNPLSEPPPSTMANSDRDSL